MVYDSITDDSITDDSITNDSITVEIITEYIVDYINNYENFRRSRKYYCWNHINNNNNDTLIKNKRKGNNYDYVEHLQNLYTTSKKISRIFSEVKLNNNNNEKGYIKKIFYQEGSAKNYKGSKFLFQGISNDTKLFIVSTDSFATKCKTINDLKNEMKNIENFPKFSINDIKLNEPNEKNESNEKYKSYETKFEINNEKNKNNKIYCLVAISNFGDKKETIRISDFFSLISNKQLYKRRDSILNFYFLDFTLGYENDFHYYIESFFEEYNNKNKTQKFRDHFIFRINFFEKQENNNYDDNDNDLKNVEKEVMNYLNPSKKYKRTSKKTSSSSSPHDSDQLNDDLFLPSNQDDCYKKEDYNNDPPSLLNSSPLYIYNNKKRKFEVFYNGINNNNNNNNDDDDDDDDDINNINNINNTNNNININKNNKHNIFQNNYHSMMENYFPNLNHNNFQIMNHPNNPFFNPFGNFIYNRMNLPIEDKNKIFYDLYNNNLMNSFFPKNQQQQNEQQDEQHHHDFVQGIGNDSQSFQLFNNFYSENPLIQNNLLSTNNPDKQNVIDNNFNFKYE